MRIRRHTASQHAERKGALSRFWLLFKENFYVYIYVAEPASSRTLRRRGWYTGIGALGLLLLTVLLYPHRDSGLLPRYAFAGAFGLLTFLLWTVLLVVGFLLLPITAGEFLGEVTREGRRARHVLRRYLHTLRTESRGGPTSIAQLETMVRTYHLGTGPTPDHNGLWARWLRRRLDARRVRYARRVRAVYAAGYNEAVEHLRGLHWETLTMDETPVVWQAPAITSLAARRVLEEHTSFTRDIFEWDSRPVTELLFTPRWVFDLVRADSSLVRDPRFELYSVVECRTRCYPVGDADRETIEKLYDRTGKGPMSDLAEVIETAKLL